MSNQRMKLWNILILLTIVLVICGTLPLQAQSGKSLQPRWWFGGAIGVNFNGYGGNVQQLNAGTLAPGAFSDGSGTGLSLAPLLGYQPDPMWGGMLTLGFDGRGGSFENSGGATLSSSMNYISIEPSVRISPFPSNFYFFVGPRIAFNVAKSFTYQPQSSPEINQEWSGVRGSVITFQLGAGYDVQVSNADDPSQVFVSPFVALHVGQGPRSEESWSLTTLRTGVAVKFGSTASAQEALARDMQFSVRGPGIIPTERRVKETFPMRNNLFFDQGSSEIPVRYVRLTPDEASRFREEQLLEPQPRDLTGRSRRQLTVYHNLLNVLGDRMRRTPSATVTLEGSSGGGAEEGKTVATAVKQYLVEVFGIDASRITTHGRSKPEHPSTAPGATRELELVRAEDRRVDIESNNPAILAPVQIVSLQEDPLDSDVLLTVVGAEEHLASWTVEVTDENGTLKRYGPFNRDQERIAGRSILGDKLQGSYSIAMVGETKGGQSVRKTESLRLVRSDEPAGDLGLRFSILFEFDQSKTVSTYERFLTSEIAPMIADGSSVIIHGHTDIIGEESHNLKLSQDRARETMNVIERAINRSGRKRVKFDTYGFGEDIRRSPFENSLPEERFYNRTVVIDIVPEQ